MIHLHMHTKYSRQLGLGAPEEFAAIAGPLSALAITDTDTMGGICDHQDACIKHGVQPIFGMEATIGKSSQLVLLAETEEGLSNLYALGGYSPTERGYDVLSAHSKGIIALTGHLGGAVPTAILRKDTTALNYHLGKLIDIFGKGSLFLEKVDWGLREHARLNTTLDKIAQRTGLRCVGTNDVHYPRREDAPWQGFMVLDALGRASSMEEMLSHRVTDAWLQPKFDDDACAQEIKQRCLKLLPPQGRMLPKFGDDDAGNLVRHAQAGLIARMGGDPPAAYRERLEYELSVILKMGFAGYFLIIEDVIRWARSRGIPVGCRGSGAGCIVSWCLRITDIDPVAKRLYFERFLNPDRVTMPDFDIDICRLRREEVIEYVRNKYGHDHVVQIATYGEYKLKKAVDAAGRVLGLQFDERQHIKKRWLSIKKEDKSEYTAQELVDSGILEPMFKHYPAYRTVLDACVQMSRGIREQGKHPGGVIILDRPVAEVLPLLPGGVTALVHQSAEQRGGVKFDFLGLVELSVLDRANACLDYALDLHNLPQDDPKVFEMLRAGRTVGVFQISGDGLTEFVVYMQPTKCDHLTAAVALYRPGPMDIGAHTLFVDRMHGRELVQYIHEDTAEALEETYGIIVYQEQILHLARKMAGMTMAQGDLLRRAIGKKDKAKLEAERVRFAEGVVRQGYTPNVAVSLWEEIETFARYGFNRAHAAAYADLAYQTAYVKAYHPAEFLAAQAALRGSDVAEVDIFMQEARLMGCVIHPPDVQTSPALSHGRNMEVWWGLAQLAGIGEDFAKTVVSMRPYKSFGDFFSRTGCDKTQFDALLYAGALDSLIGKPSFTRARAVYAHALARFPKMEALRKKEQAKQSVWLFGETYEDPAYDIKTPDGTTKRLSAFALWLNRRRVTGSWLSGHPARAFFGGQPRPSGYVTIAELPEHENRTVSVIATVIDSWSYERYRDGEFQSQAGMVIEDETGRKRLTWYDGIDFTKFGDGLAEFKLRPYIGRHKKLTYKVVQIRPVDLPEEVIEL